MSEKPKIVCVVPTIRPERMEEFRRAWADPFAKHGVTLVTVWDGDALRVEIGSRAATWQFDELFLAQHRDLFCRRTDACRNLGFVCAARLKPDYVLTLDDDVHPPPEDGWNGIPEDYDPIAEHLRALSLRVPLGWMNTAHSGAPYLRGFPYSTRDEAPVMLSHGVWVGVPDFDGETQLRLSRPETVCPLCRGAAATSDQSCVKCAGRGTVGGAGLPKTLPYYVGPVPKGVMFPLCGMNVMIRREALPYFYFAPMGRHSGVKCGRCDGDGKAHGSDRPFEWSGPGTYPGPCPVCRGAGSPLHRFADIYMGLHLKQAFDRMGWACYTGASTVLHTRASDPHKNFEQEKLGREWLEHMVQPDREPPAELVSYLRDWRGREMRYERLVRSILEA